MIITNAWACTQMPDQVGDWMKEAFGEKAKYWVSYPLVMKSNAGYYIGQIGALVANREVPFIEPWGRDTEYMTYQEAMRRYYAGEYNLAHLEFEFKGESPAFLLVVADPTPCKDQVLGTTAEKDWNQDMIDQDNRCLGNLYN